ncbi:MAG: branched-chain amino acid ABC transporter permease [Deltaproteobacteria bacterium]
MANEYDVQKQGIAKFLDYLCLTPLGAIGFLILIIFPLFPPFNQDYLIRWFILAAIMGAGAMAFDFSAGYIAVVNFGFAAFVGLGAYTSAIVADRWGIPLPLAMLCGAFTSALLGLFTGAISLRMRGMFAICLTWFIGIALMGLAIKMVWLTRGMLGLQTPYFFPPGVSNLYYWYPVLGVSLLTWFILKRIARSHMGLAFKAIGQNMDAAKTSGINPTRYRMDRGLLRPLHRYSDPRLYAHRQNRGVSGDCLYRGTGNPVGRVCRCLSVHLVYRDVKIQF